MTKQWHAISSNLIQVGTVVHPVLNYDFGYLESTLYSKINSSSTSLDFFMNQLNIEAEFNAPNVSLTMLEILGLQHTILPTPSPIPVPSSLPSVIPTNTPTKQPSAAPTS